MRPPHTVPARPRKPASQSGAARFVVVAAVLAACAVVFWGVKGHAQDGGAVMSGDSGYCLDVQHNDTAAGTSIDSWPCNGSDAQTWTVTYDTIEHGDNLCLSAAAKAAVLNPCAATASQIWLRDRDGFYNPDSGRCLALPSAQTRQQLILANCAVLGHASGTWTPDSAANNQACVGSEQEKIACNAVHQWTLWQSGTPSHEALLNTYTDGAPYEEWCADFVSYIYRQAGYPFAKGEANGWDENIADRIQDMGVFSKHDAGNYTPRTGDVAYFDYNGGHVEIVISGGPHPTFVYGNSASIDPTTGNGDMKANTITQDGTLGSVVYYLSPKPPSH